MHGSAGASLEPGLLWELNPKFCQFAGSSLHTSTVTPRKRSPRASTHGAAMFKRLLSAKGSRGGTEQYQTLGAEEALAVPSQQNDYGAASEGRFIPSPTDRSGDGASSASQPRRPVMYVPPPTYVDQTAASPPPSYSSYSSPAAGGYTSSYSANPYAQPQPVPYASSYAQPPPQQYSYGASSQERPSTAAGCVCAQSVPRRPHLLPRLCSPRSRNARFLAAAVLSTSGHSAECPDAADAEGASISSTAFFTGLHFVGLEAFHTDDRVTTCSL